MSVRCLLIAYLGFYIAGSFRMHKKEKNVRAKIQFTSENRDDHDRALEEELHVHDDVTKDIGEGAVYDVYHDGALSDVFLELKASNRKTKVASGQQQLMNRFGWLGGRMGIPRKDTAVILSGPTVVKMKRAQAPGKSWELKLGDHFFKISIEDVTGLSIEEALAQVERVPPLYRRCFEIVSETGKDGVAFYQNIGGAAAHGGHNYLNILARVGAGVMVHEAGHIMEQRARLGGPGSPGAEPDILDPRWMNAIAGDGVSVSGYGDHAVHEDQAEFAKVYALCLDAGGDYLQQLQELSPLRYALWEHMLVNSGAREKVPENPVPTPATPAPTPSPDPNWYWSIGTTIWPAQTCDEVCAVKGSTCSQAALDDLNGKDMIYLMSKYALAGFTCSGPPSQACAGGSNCVRWGSPYIHNGHHHGKHGDCWGGSQPSVAPCGQRPSDGNHRRLCPCNRLER